MGDTNTFKPYNTLIGKEGIFIWNEDKQKDDYYFIYYLDNYYSEISKIYLYKKEEDFKKELSKNIIGKTPKEYFSLRNIRTESIGYYNLIDDGTIIGKYINLIKNQIFKEEGTKSEKTSFEEVEVNIDKQKEKLVEFLGYLLINLLYIDDLKVLLNKRNEENKNKIIENKEIKKLIDEFWNIVNYFKDHKKIDSTNINPFIKLFFDKGLNESISFSEDNMAKTYQQIIKKVIEQFYSDLSLENNKSIKEDFFNLFYGTKKTEKNEENFNAILIDPNDFKIYNNNKNDICLKIEDQQLSQFNIKRLPLVLIIVINHKDTPNLNHKDTPNLNPIIIPPHIKIRNNRYSLISSINKATGGEDSLFTKIFNEHMKIMKITLGLNSFEINYYIDEKNDPKILFYKKTKIEENIYNSGKNGIYNAEADVNSNNSNNSTNTNIYCQGCYNDRGNVYKTNNNNNSNAFNANNNNNLNNNSNNNNLNAFSANNNNNFNNYSYALNANNNCFNNNPNAFNPNQVFVNFNNNNFLNH